MKPIDEIRSRESPRQILAHDFKTMGELPIRGGWGYSMADACIIDKNDRVVNPATPFNGVAIEYVFVEKRIYEELIIFRSDGEQFSDIKWKLLQQDVVPTGPRMFDKLTFAITAIPDADWYLLKAEWEGPPGHTNPDFDLAAHLRRRQELTIRFQREFWFDITSFFPTTGD